MLDLLAAWLLFPAALLAITLGCGLLVERLTGVPLPGVLLAPTGLALVFVTARLVTQFETIAGLALPALLLLALAGLWLGRARLRGAGLDVWAAAAAAGVFAVFGAPVFLSGEPTIAGSIVLPDTSNQLVLAAFVNDHGHNWQQLDVSSYRSILSKYLTTAYPVAAQSSLGALAPLGVIDLAWLYQPFLTFSAAMMALAFYALLGPVIEPRAARALASFVASQPALLVGYALQGSIKEVTGISMVVLCAAHAVRAGPSTDNVRVLIPFVVAVAAALGCLGAPAAGLTAPLAAGLIVLWGVHLARSGSRRQLIGVGIAVAVGAALVAPLVGSARKAYRVADVVLSNAGDLGNLAAPLHARQVAGIWMSGDYRYAPDGSDTLGWVLIGLMVAAAAFGVVWMLWRRALGPLLLVAIVGVVSLIFLSKGSPYADAKVLAVASPAVVLAAAVGVWGLHGVARGIPAMALALILSGGVLLSNARAYHDSRHAPMDRYAELLKIDDRYAGQGPAELNEYEEFGSYLLRKAAGWVEPERSHSFRKPALPTAPSRRPFVKDPHDLDALNLAYVETFPLLVVRRSPVTSRPPANFRRVWRGRYYDVYRRRPGPRVREHLPLGNGELQDGARPRCASVRRMGARARRLGGRLAYVEAPHLSELLPRSAKHPDYWEPYSAWPEAIGTVTQGEVTSTVFVPRDSRYVVWLEGSFGRGFTVYLDGRRIGKVAYRENYPGGHERVATVTLRRGLHHIRLFSGGGDLRPGNGGSQSTLRHVGPLELSPPANESRTVRFVDPARAAALCGRSLDWVEIVS